MKRPSIPLFITPIMLVGLPLLGVFTAGRPMSRYFEFPPETLYVHPAPFSWTYFVFYSLVFLALALPLGLAAERTLLHPRPHTVPRGRFPWWGWAGLACNGIFWGIAWTRIPSFSFLQPHTFFPLWCSYILVVNALCHRRDGTCMMMRRPVFFCLLFPVSAIFWWFFEYLNRFVQNWYYHGVEYGPVAYIGLATLSFSTVLPAVLGTRDWLRGTRWIRENFVFPPPPVPDLKPIAVPVLLLSGVGLFGIGIWPRHLFPLLWVSPLLIFLSLQMLTGEAPLLSPVFQGDLRPLVSAAVAALICGGFWEMWNFFSLAKWIYRISFVHRFEIFEMPVLGYAGYLPFGLECAVAGQLLDRTLQRLQSKRTGSAPPAA